jgi:hypothetical protein
MGALGRAHPTGLWESPLAAVTEEEAQADAVAAAAAGAPDINREKRTAEDVAADDPLSGLQKMDLLQRCRWVGPVATGGACTAAPSARPHAGARCCTARRAGAKT